jgi:protein phosphatase
VNAVETVEDAIEHLAREGHAAFTARPTTLCGTSPFAEVHGFTRSAWMFREGAPNTDNVLVSEVTVGSRKGLALAVAHGNYKDPGCYLASATAVCELVTELSESLLSEADVAPALRRGFLRACDSITRLEALPLPQALATTAGERRNLRGIGTSLTAVVVASEHAWTAHVGENRALLVSDGRVRQLVAPHTLAYAPGQVSRPDPAIHPSNEIVLNVLGAGWDRTARIDVVRAPVARGDRLILGNAGIGFFLTNPSGRDWWSGDARVVVERYVAASAELAPHVPPTLVVADLC